MHHLSGFDCSYGCRLKSVNPDVKDCFKKYKKINCSGTTIPIYSTSPLPAEFCIHTGQPSVETTVAIGSMPRLSTTLYAYKGMATHPAVPSLSSPILLPKSLTPTTGKSTSNSPANTPTPSYPISAQPPPKNLHQPLQTPIPITPNQTAQPSRDSPWGTQPVID